MGKQLQLVQQQYNNASDEIIRKTQTISELEGNVSRLSSVVGRTQDEVERLGQEVLRVRREGLDALEARETSLIDQHRKQLEHMMAGYQAQINKQQVLSLLISLHVQAHH